MILLNISGSDGGCFLWISELEHLPIRLISPTSRFSIGPKDSIYICGLSELQWRHINRIALSRIMFIRFIWLNIWILIFFVYGNHIRRLLFILLYQNILFLCLCFLKFSVSSDRWKYRCLLYHNSNCRRIIWIFRIYIYYLTL